MLNLVKLIRTCHNRQKYSVISLADVIQSVLQQIMKATSLNNAANTLSAKLKTLRQQATRIHCKMLANISSSEHVLNNRGGKGSPLGTCKASRFDSNSKVTDRFKIFESAAPAVVPQTTLTVQQKTSTVAPL